MGLAEDMKIIKNAELDIELLNRENDKLCADNNEEIANLEEGIKSTEFILEEELKASKEDKLECKFDGYKGSISWQKMPDKWIYIDKVLMDFIVNLPHRLKDLFLKTTITIKKADIKKQIISDNDNSFENNKLIPSIEDIKLFILEDTDSMISPKRCIEVKGIEVEPQDPKFKYIIKKIK